MPPKKNEGIILARRLFSEDYIKRALQFFSEIGVNYRERDNFIKSLKKLKGLYAADLLIAISFSRYCEKIIDEKDDLLRPVLLICLINAVEESPLHLKNKLRSFFKRLDNEDKLYLLNNFRILRGRGDNREFRRVYHDLIQRHRTYKCLQSYQQISIDYEKVNEDLSKINKYIEILADHFYHIRNCTLHELREISSLASFDETWKMMASVHSFYIPFKPGKKYIRTHYFVSSIHSEEFSKIIKRGILKKINFIVKK